jgi:hypothetical protein
VCRAPSRPYHQILDAHKDSGGHCINKEMPGWRSAGPLFPTPAGVSPPIATSSPVLCLRSTNDGPIEGGKDAAAATTPLIVVASAIDVASEEEAEEARRAAKAAAAADTTSSTELPRRTAIAKLAASVGVKPPSCMMRLCALQ